MQTWRDSASEQAQTDLDGLVNEALPFATEQLEKYGEFFPYDVALNALGDARMVAGDPGLGEQQESSAVLGTLIEGLRSERDMLRSVALVSDVRMSGGDAVRVQLEHAEGHAIEVFLPYKKKRFGRGIEFGGLTAGSGTVAIWS